MRFGSFTAHGKETWGLMKDEGAVLVDADTASSFPNLKSAIANNLSLIHISEPTRPY